MLSLIRHNPAIAHFWKPVTALGMLAVWFFLALPNPLFRTTYSTVVTDFEGRLLSARVAADEQWRFPIPDTLPEKYLTALLMSEDRNFLTHNGVHLPSLVRALWENLRAGKVKRGGSTLTMQVIRLSQGNPPRTLSNKIVEIILARRLETTHSKEDILRLYAAHAPFGSNVVGLESASWRYFGKSSHMLSWAEAATLAVLPNSPGLIYPGKNMERLLQKRNRLLLRLRDSGKITDETCDLSMWEPLPTAPEAIPNLAPHLLTRLVKEGHRGEICRTTLKLSMQQMVQEIVERHRQNLEASSVNNLAVLVLDTRTGSTLAYVGNVNERGREIGEEVDIIPSRRSSGSILKPFLYAMMLDDGLILPGMLVKDVPVEIGNFRPVNYSKAFNGAVPARQALARSLNIPAVLMLRDYGTARFCDRMRSMGMSTLERPASHYGLSVILGGAETRLWELCGMYASLGRILHTFSETDGHYRKGDIRPPHLLAGEHEKVLSDRQKELNKPDKFHASSVWLTFEAMKQVARPDEEANWMWFSSMPVIAWKTGTSFGNRDAWAIGVSPGYVVGVWAGNANGEGRPGLTGTTCAAPVLFDVFSRLPRSAWFDKPWDDMIPTAICRQSGHPAGPYCNDIDTSYVPDVNLRVVACPYHQLIHLDPTGKFRVNTSCVSTSEMVNQNWFVLPPLMEFYYKPLNPFYRSLPPWRPDCQPDAENKPSMEVVYPVDLGEIIIPTDISGKKEKVIFEVAHRIRNSTVYWYLDDAFIGSTEGEHKFGLNPLPGWHTLALTDQEGNRIQRRFRIADPRKGR